MKILIDDGMQIEVGTGIGKYTKYLYKYLNKNAEDEIELIRFDKGNSSKKLGRLKYLLYINSKLYRDHCMVYNIVHYTNYAMPLLKAKGVKYAVTIHDLASFIYPEMFSKLYGIYSRLAIRLAIKNADVLLTVSESVRKEIINRWPNAKGKVYVAYPGMYEEYNETVSQEYENLQLLNLVNNHFFLFVGTIEKRKNVITIFKAFEQVKKDMPNCNYKLVYAGRPGFGYDELVGLIDKSNYKKDVVLTGYISSNDVNRLYKNAAAYVFPTVYEGFGSTQLECMCNHTPLILSDIPTNREISKDYGIFFDLNSITTLVDAMKIIINDEYPYVEKNKVADKICDDYKWANLVKQYRDIYKRTIIG